VKKVKEAKVKKGKKKDLDFEEDAEEDDEDDEEEEEEDEDGLYASLVAEDFAQESAHYIDTTPKSTQSRDQVPPSENSKLEVPPKDPNTLLGCRTSLRVPVLRAQANVAGRRVKVSLRQAAAVPKPERRVKAGKSKSAGSAKDPAFCSPGKPHSTPTLSRAWFHGLTPVHVSASIAPPTRRPNGRAAPMVAGARRPDPHHQLAPHHAGRPALHEPFRRSAPPHAVVRQAPHRPALLVAR
jgi:hypothetical protein